MIKIVNDMYIYTYIYHFSEKTYIRLVISDYIFSVLYTIPDIGISEYPCIKGEACIRLCSELIAAVPRITLKGKLRVLATFVFVCNLWLLLKILSELRSWSCRGTSSWVVGQLYHRSILSIGHFFVSNFVRSSTASIYQEVYEFWTASPLSLYRRSADCSI